MDGRVTRWICLVCLLLVIASCGEEKAANTENSNRGKKLPRIVEVPDFNMDSAYHYIEKQLAFGPRVPGTQAHVQTKAYLKLLLERHGARASIQSFQAERHDGKSLSGYNIIGEFYPERKTRILLCAHWDSRYTADQEDESKMVPGANDGASGVGVLLEMARHFSKVDPNIGVDIVFFDLEDQGKTGGGSKSINTWGLGAQHWSRNPHRLPSQIQMGILLDMVGAKNATFYREGYSDQFAKTWVDQIWTLADQMGYGNYFINQPGGAVTDDHYFINTIAGIPTLDIIHKERTNTGFFAHWHTTKDDLSAIDRQTLKAVGRVATKSVYQIGADLAK